MDKFKCEVCEYDAFDKSGDFYICENCNSCYTSRDVVGKEVVLKKKVVSKVKSTPERVRTVAEVSPKTHIAETSVTPRRRGLALAIISMCISIFGILVSFAEATGITINLVGIIIGIIAKARGSKSKMATAGVIIGIIGLVISIVYTIYLEY